eukprot:s1341_g4.t1
MVRRKGAILWALGASLWLLGSFRTTSFVQWTGWNGHLSATRTTRATQIPKRKKPGLLRRAGLEIAEELAGPGSRELLTEFRRSYRENPYPERLSLFFPDYDRIIGILYQGQNYTSNRFLNTVDTVFRQFHAWPSAWPGLERLLAPEHPWSEAYCKQLIAGGYWSPFDFFTVNLDTLRPLQRYPLSELKAQSRTGFRVVERWLANLEKSDPKTQALLQRFKEQDAINAKEQIMQLRPLEDLLEHLLSRVLNQVLQACENSDEALTAIVTARDRRQRTILHVAAEQGNTNLAEMFLNSVAEESRAFFATAVDAGGLVNLGDTGLEWCAVQGIESVGDLAFFFTSYDEARAEAEEAVAQAWLSAQTEASGSAKGLLLDLYARQSPKAMPHAQRLGQPVPRPSSAPPPALSPVLPGVREAAMPRKRAHPTAAPLAQVNEEHRRPLEEALRVASRYSAELSAPSAVLMVPDSDPCAPAP